MKRGLLFSEFDFMFACGFVDLLINITDDNNKWLKNTLTLNLDTYTAQGKKAFTNKVYTFNKSFIQNKLHNSYN